MERATVAGWTSEEEFEIDQLWREVVREETDSCVKGLEPLAMLFVVGVLGTEPASTASLLRAGETLSRRVEEAATLCTSLATEPRSFDPLNDVALSLARRCFVTQPGARALWFRAIVTIFEPLLSRAGRFPGALSFDALEASMGLTVNVSCQRFREKWNAVLEKSRHVTAPRVA